MITVRVDIYLFTEGNAHIAYCPALDLSGYGYTETEAKESFAQTIKMYIGHCLAKNTLKEDLRQHGWNIRSLNQKKIKAPSLQSMLRRLPDFRHMAESSDYSKYSENIYIPELA